MKESKWFDSSQFFGQSTRDKSTRNINKRKLESSQSKDENCFKKPAVAERGLSSDELWSDLYSPKSVDDLAVHNKKVSDVKDWLQESISGDQNQRSKSKTKFLLLSGPSGSGKTAVIQALAKELEIELVGWENPVESISYHDKNRNILTDVYEDFEDRITFTSQKQIFRDWLKGSRYSTLGCSESNGKLLMIEDFPSVALTNPSEFKEILISYSKSKQNTPLVLICSEDSGSKDSLLKTIFKSDFISSLGIENIVFNPATTTNIVKLLTKIATEAQKTKSKNIRVPDKAALEGLSESTGGDIRAAINALQFACLNSSSGTNDYSSVFNSGNTTIKSSKSKSKKSTKSLKTSSQSTVGNKDKTLDMFHALGKILYAKREDAPESGFLPEQLEYQRRKPLSANPEEVCSLTNLSEEAFTCFLHHNYPPFYSDVNDVSRMLDYFSLCDPLLQDWGTTGKIDVKEYGVSVVARSVMFCNKNPAASKGMRKLTKPEFYSNRRQIEANKERLESAAVHLNRCFPKTELSTVILPGLTKIKHKYPGLRSLQDLAHFPTLNSVKSSTVGTEKSSKSAEDEFLSEDDDFFDEFLDDFDEVDDPNRQDGKETPTIKKEEEFIIEEYDSD